MKELMEEIDALITMYYTLKDDDELIDQYHDAIYYDIMGYEESIYEAKEDNDIDWLNEIRDDLKNNVEAFVSIAIALKKVKFIYG